MARLIDLYKEWMETNDVYNGLCGRIPVQYEETFELLVPSVKEKRHLEDTGFCSAYWASGLPYYHKNEMSAFTPLRQTIVLLIACIHEEY